MRIKIKTDKLKRAVKKIIHDAKESCFDKSVTKPEYIDLNLKKFSVLSQRNYAALGGVKGAAWGAGIKTRWAARSRRNTIDRRTGKPLLSQEAVDRVTKRKVRDAVERAEVPLSQDISNAAKKIGTGIKNTPKTIKKVGVAVGKTAKDLYSDTGNTIIKFVKWNRENPALASGQVAATISRGAGLIVGGPAGAAAQVIPTAAPVTVLTAFFRSPNKVVTYNGRQMRRGRADKLASNKIGERWGKKIGGRSIKNTPKAVKRAIKRGINNISYPKVNPARLRVTA